MSEEAGALVDIWVIDRGPRPIRVYQKVDHLTRLNLKQARKLVDSAPQAVITQVPRTQAEALKIEMEATGAIVELRPAETPGGPSDLV
jgi:large subunit ribosomal protein L7/L12